MSLVSPSNLLNEIVSSTALYRSDLTRNRPSRRSADPMLACARTDAVEDDTHPYPVVKEPCRPNSILAVPNAGIVWIPLLRGGGFRPNRLEVERSLDPHHRQSSSPLKNLHDPHTLHGEPRFRRKTGLAGCFEPSQHPSDFRGAQSSSRPAWRSSKTPVSGRGGAHLSRRRHRRPLHHHRPVAGEAGARRERRA